MAVQACSQFFARSVDLVTAPYEEAKRQLYLALFSRQSVSCSVHPPSLIGRITHLTTGLLSLFPGLNYIIYIAMCHFGYDLGHRFCLATKAKGLDELQFYLDLGWSPNHRSKGKPLLFSAYEGDGFDAFSALAQNKGCDLNVMYQGKTLLHVAAELRDWKAVELLLNNGANPNIKRVADQKTAALIAYDQEDTNLALTIARAGNGVNDIADRRENTLLNHAWNNKDFPMILGLLELGASPPKEFPISHFELFECAIKRRSECAVKMADSGWDINCQGKDGVTPLELAVNGLHWGSARKLIERGANMKSHANERDIGLEYWSHIQSHDYKHHFLRHPDVFPGGRLSVLTGDTYLSFAMDEIVKRCRAKKINPLEVIYFTGSDKGMQALSRTLTFSEFNKALTELKRKYPRLLISWVFNALFRIPSHHFKRANGNLIESESDQVQSPPKTVYYNEIVDVFKGMNFKYADRPNFLDRDARTFDGVTYIPADFNESLIKLITSVRDKKELKGMPSEKNDRLKAYQRLQILLRQIAYLLTEPSIDQKTKDHAILELAYEARQVRNWPRALYRAYCALSGADFNELSTDDKVMNALGQLRLTVVNEIFTDAEYSYALYKLVDAKKIPIERPDNDLAFSQIQMDPNARFERNYHPSTMIKWIFEASKKDPFFKADLLDWTEENLVGRWIEPAGGDLKEAMHSTEEVDQLTLLSNAMVLQGMGHIEHRDSKSFSRSFSGG